MTKIWTNEEVIHLVLTNDEACRRALIQLYNRQTQDEQRVLCTRHDNARGFNKPDGPILSSMAQFAISKGILRPRQLWKVRQLITKYGRQLVEIANEVQSKRDAAKSELLFSLSPVMTSGHRDGRYF
jgi:hypothetical protein